MYLSWRPSGVTGPAGRRGAVVEQGHAVVEGHVGVLRVGGTPRSGLEERREGRRAGAGRGTPPSPTAAAGRSRECTRGEDERLLFREEQRVRRRGGRG